MKKNCAVKALAWGPPVPWWSFLPIWPRRPHRRLPRGPSKAVARPLPVAEAVLIAAAAGAALPDEAVAVDIAARAAIALLAVAVAANPKFQSQIFKKN